MGFWGPSVLTSTLTVPSEGTSRVQLPAANIKRFLVFTNKISVGFDLGKFLQRIFLLRSRL